MELFTKQGQYGQKFRSTDNFRELLILWLVAFFSVSRMRDKQLERERERIKLDRRLGSWLIVIISSNSSAYYYLLLSPWTGGISLFPKTIRE